MATVLVIDGDGAARAAAAAALELDGYVVEQVADRERAFAIVERTPPDLIVVDTGRPGHEGIAILEALKSSRPAVAQVPVVMVGSGAERLERIRALIEGAIVFLDKPVEAAELSDTVRDVLAGGPERAQRRKAQTAALAELARIETAASRPGASIDPRAARPRLTRLEPVRDVAVVTKTRPVLAREVLSPRQNEIVDAVIAAGTLRKAAEQLHVSRTYLYASLRRIADKVGVASGPDLVRALTAGGLDDGR